MPSLETALTRALRRNLFLALVLAMAALLVWYAWTVLLFAFAGLLLAVVLRAWIEWLSAKTGLGKRSSYWAVVLGLAVIIELLGWLILPRALSEASQIASQLPGSLSRLREVGGSAMPKAIVDQVQKQAQNAVTSLIHTLSNAMDAVAGLIVALVVGLYGAADPGPYHAGLLLLVPEQHRDRAADVFSEIAYILRWWVFGQLVPMAVLGVATMIGLWLMHIPLAFTLGLFTGIMIFIPYLGALAAGVPAALMGLLQSPMKMVWVILLFLCIHGAEGYAITPLVQRRAVRLPPIITILAQLLMWTITGLLGVIFATPLVAAALAVIKVLFFHQTPAYKQG